MQIIIIPRMALHFLVSVARGTGTSLRYRYKHALEKVRVAFGLLQSARCQDGSGVKSPAVNASPAMGGCEKGKLVL